MGTDFSGEMEQARLNCGFRHAFTRQCSDDKESSGFLSRYQDQVVLRACSHFLSREELTGFEKDR